MSFVGVTMMFVACSFGGSQGNDPQPDAATSGAHCGDGTCAASEVNNCPADCGGGSNQGSNAVCGNGQCETTKGETAASCPSDCMSQGSGSGSGSGMCPADPTACLGCILDMTQCTGGLDQNTCIQCLLGGSGSGSGSGLGCVGGFPNGVCDPGEDANNCPFDCP